MSHDRDQPGAESGEERRLGGLEREELAPEQPDETDQLSSQEADRAEREGGHTEDKADRAGKVGSTSNSYARRNETMGMRVK